MRTNVYVDGFNLYYGALKGTPYRWLDIATLCTLLLPNHQIHRIRYFTARIQPLPNDSTKHQRQDAYLRALQTIPQATIHFGHYLKRPIRMPLVNSPNNNPQFVEVWRIEEKGSDVNLATYLSWMASNKTMSRLSSFPTTLTW